MIAAGMLLALTARADGVPPIVILFFLLAALAFVVYSVRARREAFFTAGTQLGLEGVTATSDGVRGTVDGMTLGAHQIQGSKRSPPHMVIEVAFSPCELLLDLRLQTGAELRAVERGEAVDLQTGDAAFDAAWIVEGAPAARVLRVLESRELRRGLLDLSGSPEARVTIEDGKLTIFRRGTDVGAGVVHLTRMELALELARAVVAESAKLPPEEVAPAGEARADYRTSPRRAAADDGAERIRELKATRAIRRLHAARWPIALGHAAVPALAVFFAVNPPDAEPAVQHVLAVAGALLQIIPTVATIVFLGSLRTSAPGQGVRLEPATRNFMAASWAALLAIVLYTGLR